MNCTPFTTQESIDPTDFSCFIPSIHSMPIKFLGRVIDGSLSDRKSVDELEEKLASGLKLIDQSLLKGAQKLWILQHLLVPRNTMASYDLRSFILCSYKIGTKSILLHQKMAWPSSHHLKP